MSPNVCAPGRVFPLAPLLRLCVEVKKVVFDLSRWLAGVDPFSLWFGYE